MAAFFLLSFLVSTEANTFPIVVTTWNGTGSGVGSFENATAIAFSILSQPNISANDDRVILDALEQGVNYCELYQCHQSVGYGAKPDESGEPTLDAMIMHGSTQLVGAVGGLRGIKTAISVARDVMDYTDHTLLVGSSATNFAIEMGFLNESLKTNNSDAQWTSWVNNNCQPNHRRNVYNQTTCGPYSPIPRSNISSSPAPNSAGIENHDTIAMIVIDKYGRLAAGTSTNGLIYKVPGRVGDTPIMGAGAYADSEIGACGATGNGDVMMRFLPCYRTVMNMAMGMSPEEAARDAINRIVASQPGFSGAIIALNKKGDYGAATIGYNPFGWNVQTPDMAQPTVIMTSAFQPTIPSSNINCGGGSSSGHSDGTLAGVGIGMVILGLLLGCGVGYLMRKRTEEKRGESLLR